MHFKLVTNTQLFQNNQAKIIYIKYRLEGTIKDQLHLFIKNDLTFLFINTNAIFISLSSLYNNSDRIHITISTLGNLHQQNKSFFNFILKFT